MKLIETDKQYVIKGKARCNDCKGTGLYQGRAEEKGAFVVCLECEGKGRVEIKITYDKFVTLVKEPKCKRVYSNSMGYVITDQDVTSSKGQFMPFSKYGCSYEDWLKGKNPTPLKLFGCPYQETNQGLQVKDKNNLYKTRCRDNINLGRSITNCKLYADKTKCWEIYEK